MRSSGRSYSHVTVCTCVRANCGSRKTRVYTRQQNGNAMLSIRPKGGETRNRGRENSADRSNSLATRGVFTDECPIGSSRRNSRKIYFVIGLTECSDETRDDARDCDLQYCSPPVAARNRSLKRGPTTSAIFILDLDLNFCTTIPRNLQSNHQRVSGSH